MIIKDNKKIQEVQKEFNDKFPYLKLEFYMFPHEPGKGNPDQQKLDNTKTIDEIRNTHQAGELSINGHLKVSTLEQNFKEIYGLNVQVFRKSGTLWLQTIKTDDWTLTEQNQIAESFGKKEEV